jgi:hypothetical protein
MDAAVELLTNSRILWNPKVQHRVHKSSGPYPELIQIEVNAKLFLGLIKLHALKMNEEVEL